MPIQSRQLAAIMPARDPSPKAMAAGDRSFSEGRLTDIVGYTPLMGEDAQKRRCTCRGRFARSIINNYHSKWQKEIVDGTLAKSPPLSQVCNL